MGLSHHDVIVLLLSMSVMLIFSRLASELGRTIKLPVVMGEIVVGILLGPTIFGSLAPDTASWIFPDRGNASIALEGIIKISVIMMLFVAGMEVQLPLVLKQGRAAISTSFFSMLVPFGLGFYWAFFRPDFFEYHTGDPLLFSLFVGTALSISALPVIARILIDMGIFRTRIGSIIIASAMFNDLLGWLIFSFILASFQQSDLTNVWITIASIFGFGIFMLTIGKNILNRTLPWIQTRLSWPGGVLSISLGVCFLSAAFTEIAGIHAILGAFIAGIAVGDSVHLREEAREIIHQFVTNIFAPLFFVSIGLKVNFHTHFDWSLVLGILGLSYLGKILGAFIGSRIGGFPNREALAIGFGLNARGAMEIILGTLALNAGLINEKLFVALVIMALVTSLTSGPMIRLLVPGVLSGNK